MTEANDPAAPGPRLKLLTQLRALNRNLQHYRVPPLVTMAAADALDEVELERAVRASAEYLIRMARAMP